MQENQKRSPFLRLPPEIRNKIYQRAFSNFVAHMRLTKIRFPKSLPQFRYFHDNPITLLFTCRQIRHEASMFFYTLSTFSFRNYMDMNGFVTAHGPEKASMITSIRASAALIDFVLWENLGSRRRLFDTELPNLRRVDVWNEHCKRVPLDLIEKAMKQFFGKAELEINFSSLSK